MNLPKGVHRVSKRLADGTVKNYYYWRATGKKLEGEPGTAEFAASIEEAKAETETKQRTGTFGQLVVVYKRSPDYQKLSSGAKKAYDRVFEKVRVLNAYPVRKITRTMILEMRDSMALHFPQAANQMVQVLSALFHFAWEREYVDFNPLVRVRRIKGGHHKRWPEKAIQHALEHFEEPYRRAVVLALYTGQRAGDCISMTWADYDGSGIAVVQHKTGEPVWIPCHKELKAELDSWEKTATTILTNSHGRPWKGRSFYQMMHRKIHEHPELNGLVFHGLRKAAAARLAEAGCGEREIMSITGHRSAAMVDLYTREVNQRRMAQAAITRLENHRRT